MGGNNMHVVSTLIVVLLLCGCIDQSTTCNKPYILVGKDCCLDENNDGICDKDKPSTTPQTILSCPGDGKNYCEGDVAYTNSICESGRWKYETKHCDYGCEQGACKSPSCYGKDCNDGNPCTVDYCSESTGSACKHDVVSGAQNGCSGSAGKCKRYVCLTGNCITENEVPCCGNLICEQGETFSTCPSDCKPKLNVIIEGCDKGFDLSNSMGEVTNVYVRIQNIGENDASGIYARASATDEGRPHPNKDLRLGDIPFNHERVIKLTVDTTSKKTTGITVDVTTEQGQKAEQSTKICNELDKSQKEMLEKLIIEGIKIVAAA